MILLDIALTASKKKCPKHPVVACLRFMIHGPCGALNYSSPCMKERQCTKRYPKSFRESTSDQDDGYPEYRRRNSGVYHLPNGLCVDNRWVVPYNRALLLKYNAHINVEVCSSIYAVKYLHKYVHKGGDRAEVEYIPNATEALDGHTADASGLQPAPQDEDEVHQYQEGRYISTSEAVWRAFSFPLPPERLPITLFGNSTT